MTPDEFMDIKEAEAVGHRYYASLGALIMYCLENDIWIDFQKDYQGPDYVLVTFNKGFFHEAFVLHRSLLTVPGELCLRMYRALSKLEDKCKS